MIEDRSVLILYSTAVCNLKCTYCFIDKNPALRKIDNLLAESFSDPDYYFNFCKKVFPDKEQLKEIQIWGGEPTLDFKRITPTIKKVVDHYPNISTIMFSTNLAHETCIDEIYYLLSSLDPHRQISIQLQLSLDGPEYITDANRGSGTTAAFSHNFARLVATVDRLLDKMPNLTINSFNKSTLNIESILALQCRYKIIDYYTFLERFYKVSLKCKSDRFTFTPSVPNTACPLPITVDVGKKFANMVKLCREIEKDNTDHKIFSFYTDITPYSKPFSHSRDFCNRGCCGTGKYCVGLLPDNIISTCHNGFTALLESYKEFAINNNVTDLQSGFFKVASTDNSMVFEYEKLSDYELQIEQFYNTTSSNTLKAIVGEIQLLAIAKQIDIKYRTVENAVDGAYFILNHCVNCVRDNLNITGTKVLVPVNLLKLLLNGAKDYIEEGITDEK